MKDLFIKNGDAINIIQSGGVLIMPTDTAYGVTCNAADEPAVERIFKIKGRDQKKSFTVHIADIGMLYDWVDEIPDPIMKLVRVFWPGDLNIVFKTNREVKYVTKKVGEHNTVAIRLPAHDTPQKLSCSVNGSIIGTSANFAGKPAAYSLDQLDEDFVKLTDGIIEGQCGNIRASAVVGVDDNGVVVVYREGRITKEMVENVI